jgi:tRNA(Ile)-lysidine synthase
LVLDGPAGRTYHRIVLSTILRKAVRGCSPAAEPGYEALDRLVRAWQAGEVLAVDLPGRVRVTVTCAEVVVAGRPDRPRPVPEVGRGDPAELPVPGVLRLEGLDASLRVEAVSPAPDDAGERSGAGVAWMDADAIRPPLRVRGRRPGDRYRPLGLTGSVKVQDLMVDRKIPRRWRDLVPVLTDQQGILWIPGFRVDDRSRITERTNTALRIEISGCLPWLAGAERE